MKVKYIGSPKSRTFTVGEVYEAKYAHKKYYALLFDDGYYLSYKTEKEFKSEWECNV